MPERRHIPRPPSVDGGSVPWGWIAAATAGAFGALAHHLREPEPPPKPQRLSRYDQAYEALQQAKAAKRAKNWDEAYRLANRSAYLAARSRHPNSRDLYNVASELVLDVAWR